MLVSTGRELLPQQLPPPIPEETAWTKHKIQGPPHSLQHNRELMEHNLIQRVLVDRGYSLSDTAQTLGISRVTLYKKMKKYGLAGRRGHD